MEDRSSRSQTAPTLAFGMHRAGFLQTNSKTRIICVHHSQVPMGSGSSPPRRINERNPKGDKTFMATEQTCPQCGAALPDGGWEGLCPKCLVRVSLEANPGEPGSGKPHENATVAQPDMPTERAGMMVGRYKLLQQIGEGGFGVVFMAEQAEPVQRKVALKIIKAGMDTREVIARFEA